MQTATETILNTCKDYENVFIYLLNKHGKNAIYFDEDNAVINVTLSNVYYNISLSGNETKFYFGNVQSKIIQGLEYSDFIQLKSFRVFSFDLAVKYIDFKEKENELIRSIEG